MRQANDISCTQNGDTMICPPGANIGASPVVTPPIGYIYMKTGQASWYQTPQCTTTEYRIIANDFGSAMSDHPFEGIGWILTIAFVTQCAVMFIRFAFTEAVRAVQIRPKGGKR